MVGTASLRIHPEAVEGGALLVAAKGLGFSPWGKPFEEDKLEEEFRRLEMRLEVEKELHDMKKKVGEQQRR